MIKQLNRPKAYINCLEGCYRRLKQKER